MGPEAFPQTLTTTDGHLLNGRVRYTQPRSGFRSGIEPVLLAAAVPARAGERVLEGGSGAGATLLCLAERVPNLRGVGIEQDASLVALASSNAAANGYALSFIGADIAAFPDLGMFEHACANPPYHRAAGTPSPDSARRTAKRGDIALIVTWVTSLARALRPHGTLTLILPASLLPEAAIAFANADCPATAVLPLWPKSGQPAKLMLLRGVRGGRTPFRILPGLVLHSEDGSFSPEAEAILRHAAALSL